MWMFAYVEVYVCTVQCGRLASSIKSVVSIVGVLDGIHDGSIIELFDDVVVSRLI